jgi:WD40 repeat protein
VFTIEEHLEPITCLAWSPDGATLASGDAAALLVLWDVKSRQARHSFYLEGVAEVRFRAEAISSVAFSPDSKYLVTTTGTYPPDVRIWDVSTAELRHELKGGFSTAAAAFSADGTTVFGAGGSGYNQHSRDFPVYHWGPCSARPDRIVPGHTDYVFALAVEPNGHRLATGGADKTARLWDAVTGSPLGPSYRHRAMVRALALAPGGTTLASAAGRTIYLWALGPRRRKRELAGHKATISGLAFHPAGHLLASASDDCTVGLWDVASGQQRAALDWKIGMVNAVAFAPDGMTAAAGGAGGDIVIWDVED